MFKHFTMSAAALSFAILTGCASVPMESPEKDQAYKTFPAPPHLKKSVKIDGEIIGETAANTYFYRLVTPGKHTLATESEFSDNLIELDAIAGKNHYVRQSIKMGVFVGGAKLTEASESEGQKAVAKTELAR